MNELIDGVDFGKNLRGFDCVLEQKWEILARNKKKRDGSNLSLQCEVIKSSIALIRIPAHDKVLIKDILLVCREFTNSMQKHRRHICQKNK
ncbi:hypothetical protein ACJIZ3_023140 [Penstemon smallii]|uniref:Uncharacterized protein n=1 Tax=Penstemon smallii TaxID=265156 RepID=A0ABD3TNA6_9LAMI